MRSLGVIAGLICAAAVLIASFPPLCAAEQFPYTAYVAQNDVYVRSGPGKNYYPTEKLAKGDPVEVYRHDPGGWYAVRPPEGSFSWVPADALKQSSSGLATVKKDRTAAFVGTSFSSARDVNQVRLEQGEEVEIIDVKTVGEGEGAQKWCQIAPPSGEFRWVYGKYLDRTPPSGLSSPSEDRRRARGDRTARNRDDSNRSDREIPVSTAWTGKGSGANAEPGAARGPSWRSTKNSSTAATDPVVTDSGDPFQTELKSLDLALSQMVAQEPESWDFAALRRRSESLLSRAHDALERGQARLVLNRVGRFEDVQRRHELINQPGSALASARQGALTVDEPARYDGVGKLTPVVAQRPNAPRFALVDETNQVISFVTPAPGVNLQPYVGREVGLSGQRGFMPELNKPHVTAARVNVLEGTIVR